MILKLFVAFYLVTFVKVFANFYQKLDIGNYANLTTTEVLQQKCNATTEEYNFFTPDGYNITFFRAYYNKAFSPVLLGHGIFMNSLGFVSIGKNSLVCSLLKKYDVWLINFRGTRYSNTHVNLTRYDIKFWYFSFHQMAEYDLRQAVDLVYEKTNKKIVYIGFSMGTTVGFIYCSMFPKEAESKLLGMVAMAPEIYLNNAKTILIKISRLWPLVKPLGYILWQGEILRRNKIVLNLCSDSIIGIFFCELLRSFVFGFGRKQLDPKTRAVSNYMNPDSISINVLNHYYQWVVTKKINYFNYGKRKNLKIYGTKNSPEYDFSKISIPQVFIVGKNDWLAVPKNAKKFYEMLNPKIRCGFEFVAYDEWTHDNFVSGKSIQIYLNPLVLKTISNFEQSKCTSNTTTAS